MHKLLYFVVLFVCVYTIHAQDADIAFFNNFGTETQNGAAVFIHGKTEKNTAPWFPKYPPPPCVSPYVVTPNYTYGSYHNNNSTALIAIPATTDSLPYVDGLQPSAIKVLASFNQIGATYGLAYKQVTHQLFASAYIKRHTGLGPFGTGAIYQMDLTGVLPPTLFADLNALFGANTAGTDPHPYLPTDVCVDAFGGFSNFACWYNDVNAFNVVGRQGLGDMDISEDGKYLYVMNMSNKTLYKISTDVPTLANITLYPFPTNLPGAQITCGNPIQVRPMGLGIKNGKVYAAAICSQEVDSPFGGNWGGDYFYVYELTPSTGVWKLVLEGSSQSHLNRSFTWPAVYQDNYGDGANMIISDLDFDNSGGMFIGVRDISGDKYGNTTGKPIAGDGAGVFYASFGDILKACFDGTSGKYILENNGSCGGLSTNGPADGEGLPLGNATAKEYFFGDRITSNVANTEISLGSMVYIANSDEILVTGYDLTAVFQQGVFGLSNATGARTLSSVTTNNSGLRGQFGKANGLGDLALVCVAPVCPEIDLKPLTICTNSSNVKLNPIVTPLAPFNYVWSPNDGSLSSITSKDPNVLTFAPGAKTYTVTVTNAVDGCSASASMVLTTEVCPPMGNCNLQAVFQQEFCKMNGTPLNGTDDYFTVKVTASTTSTGPGALKYEVMLWPSSEILNPGGTLYGQSVTVGTPTTFLSNGSSTYMLKVRNYQDNTCQTQIFTTQASQNCSNSDCSIPFLPPIIRTN